MVAYRLYLYIIVGYTREILGERVEEHVISCKVETYNSNV